MYEQFYREERGENNRIEGGLTIGDFLSDDWKLARNRVLSVCGIPGVSINYTRDKCLNCLKLKLLRMA